jgi:hypothetical protein
MNIFGLSPTFATIEEQLVENAGELTPELEALLAEAITESGPALEQAGFLKLALRKRVEICKERKAALDASIRAAEASEERVDAALEKILAVVGKQKFPEFTLSTTTRESVSFALKPGVQAFELPEQFVRVREPELVLTALKEARKAGQLPEGLLDVMATESTSVTLRRAGVKAAEAPNAA